MKSYLSTPALSNRIEKMNEEREKCCEWSAEDEQTLAFLVELHILRLHNTHQVNEAKKIEELIYKLHDDIQDEKGLLVY